MGGVGTVARMSRIRSLKPGFFKSRSLSKLSVPARITFAGLWCEADDEGRGIADARLLKGAIWPLDDDITHETIEEHLDALGADHITLYEVAGERFYEVNNWEAHQSPQFRRNEGVHPAPEGMLRAPRGVPEKGEGSKEKGGGRGARIPDEFTVTPEMKAWVEARCPNIDWQLHTENFVDWAKSTTSRAAVKKDWGRAWKTWMRREEDRVPAWVKGRKT